MPPGGRKALDALYSLCAFLPELFALTSLAIILRLLTSLKQVCDHPRVYDKESPERAELSELGDDELQEIFGGKGGS